MSPSRTAGPPAGPSLAEVLRLGLKVATPRLPAHQWKILRALLACRTPALGGHRYQCQQCGRTHFVPHSCRNRHCPLCQGQAAHRWLEQQQAALLPVPYFHVVFTLPHELNGLIRQNQRALYNLLFRAATDTLLAFGRERWGAQLGITAVLHTWSQTLLDHYHLHCIVTGGGLSEEGTRWVSTPGHYLFAVRALSAVFRGKFCSGLEQLQARGQLQFHGQLQDLAQAGAFKALLRRVVRRKWVVYTKQPFAGPGQVLAYLSRYTHRVAISPRRLLALDPQAQTVTFAWKDYAQGSRPKTLCLELPEFVRRFCLHLLPERFVKIRHFGFLSNRQRHTRLAQARRLLPSAQAPTAATQVPRPAPASPSDAPPGQVCPFCGCPQLRLVEIVAPTGSTPSVLILDSS